MADDLAAKLAELERRIRNLESAPTAQNTSIDDGLITIKQDGAAVVEVGKIGAGSPAGLGVAEVPAEYGIRVKTKNGRVILRASGEYGLEAPGNSIPVVASSTFSWTAANTYQEIWRGDFYSVGEYVDYDVSAYIAAGGQGQWRIQCYEVGRAPYTVYTNPLSSTHGQQFAGRVTIPGQATIEGVASADPRGRHMTLRFQSYSNITAQAIAYGLYMNAHPLNRGF